MVFLVVITLILLTVVFLKIQRRRENVFRKKVNEVYSRKHSLDNSVSLEDYLTRPRAVLLDTKPLPLEADISFSAQTESALNQEFRNPTQPVDLMADLRLNIQEAQLGTDIEVKIKHLELCSACRGTGCGYCSAQGTRREAKKLRITVPSGVKSGTRLRVRGEGDNGGDLYLYLLIDADETMQEDI